MKTKFKLLKGYENKYMLSSDGHVWRINNNKELKRIPNFTTSVGYTITNIYWEGGRKSLYLQKAIMEHFGESRDPEKWVITHIDGDKTNNNINNLKWITRKEMREKIKSRGEKVEVYDADTGETREYSTKTEACKANGLSVSTLKRIIEDGYVPIRGKNKNRKFKLIK